MGFFKQRKPRGFSHQYIYVDERRERLKAMEERIKREMGIVPEAEKTTEERIRGKFVEQTSHLRRQQEKGNPSSSKWLIIIAALLIALLFALLN
jgi:Flp pilus assembly protein TadB